MGRLKPSGGLSGTTCQSEIQTPSGPLSGSGGLVLWGVTFNAALLPNRTKRELTHLHTHRGPAKRSAYEDSWDRDYCTPAGTRKATASLGNSP